MVEKRSHKSQLNKDEYSTCLKGRRVTVTSCCLLLIGKKDKRITKAKKMSIPMTSNWMDIQHRKTIRTGVTFCAIPSCLHS